MEAKAKAEEGIDSSIPFGHRPVKGKARAPRKERVSPLQVINRLPTLPLSLQSNLQRKEVHKHQRLMPTQRLILQKENPGGKRKENPREPERHTMLSTMRPSSPINLIAFLTGLTVASI